MVSDTSIIRPTKKMTFIPIHFYCLTEQCYFQVAITIAIGQTLHLCINIDFIEQFLISKEKWIYVREPLFILTSPSRFYLISSLPSFVCSLNSQIMEVLFLPWQFCCLKTYQTTNFRADFWWVIKSSDTSPTRKKHSLPRAQLNSFLFLNRALIEQF